MYIEMTGARPRFADLLGVLYSPSTTDLLREYRGLAGACAQLNANQVAATPFNLHSKNDPDSSEIKSHPLLDVIQNPNPYMDDKLLWKTTQLYLEMCGKAFWQVVPGVLNPVNQIYPLQSHLVSPIMGADNQIIAWQYAKKRLELSEVVEFYFTDPLNPYSSGKGPAELAWNEIVLMNSDTALMTALMKNGGAPAHILSPKDAQGVISKSIVERMYAAWNAFRGKGANKLWIPEIPVELKSLAQTSKEFQGSERFDQLKSIILACFGIPAALFDSAGTRAELDAAMVQHARLAIDPRTSLLEGTINRRVCSLFGPNVFLFFEENLPEDTTAQGTGLPTPPNPSTGTEMNPDKGKTNEE
jgi:phage portal protein BeeE